MKNDLDIFPYDPDVVSCCISCGIPFNEHLGIIKTCEQLQREIKINHNLRDEIARLNLKIQSMRAENEQTLES